MEGDSFVLTTVKKLRSNWSSHSFSTTLNAYDIDKIRNNFESFDKKTKMKILIALIGMDRSVRSTIAPSIKRLLSAACSDKDEWVPVIAGLVHGKIFPVSDPLIQSRTDDIIRNTVSKITEELSSQSEIAPERVEDFLIYQPFEESYFQSSLEMRTSSSSAGPSVCPHFVYTSLCPNYLERELKIMEEKKIKEQAMAKRPEQPPSSATQLSSTHSTGPSRPTTLPGGARSSLLSSAQFQAGPKKGAVTLSDANVRDIDKKRKLDEQESKKQEKMQKLEAKKLPEKIGSKQLPLPIQPPSTSGSRQVQPLSQPKPAALPPTLSSPEPVLLNQPSNSSLTESFPASQPTLVSSAALSTKIPPPLPPLPPQPSSNISSDILSSHPEIPESLIMSPFGKPISSFFEEGVMLTQADKQQIIQFFLDRLSNTAQDNAVPPVEMKFKLYEEETENGKATYSLTLSSNGQWKKIKKLKK